MNDKIKTVEDLRTNPMLKRKFRWGFSAEFEDGLKIAEHFVRLNHRPSPGDTEITVTFTDDGDELKDVLEDVLDCAAQAYKVSEDQKVDFEGYYGKGTLTLYDGCGEKLEQWDMSQLCFSAINFGDLDFSSSEATTLEITFRIGEIRYQNFCKPQCSHHIKMIDTVPDSVPVVSSSACAQEPNVCRELPLPDLA